MNPNPILKNYRMYWINGLLLSACSWSVRTSSVPAQKNGENTAVVQTPAVVEPEQSSKASIQEKPSQKVAIADLADGNYKFCTESPSYQAPSGLDVKGYCFVFRKTNKSVVGQYFYSAPKGDRRVCISGVLNGNMVTGVGYELMFGWSEPVKPADIASMPPEATWGDSKGRSLKISPPRLYATGKDAAGYLWLDAF